MNCLAPNQQITSSVIGNSIICSDISKLLYVISQAVRQVKFETILKYHEWYLCQISRANHAIICLYYYPQKVCNFPMQVFQIKLKCHCSKPIKLQKFLMQQYQKINKQEIIINFAQNGLSCLGNIFLWPLHCGCLAEALKILEMHPSIITQCLIIILYLSQGCHLGLEGRDFPQIVNPQLLLQQTK